MGNDNVFTVGHPVVTAELKVTRSIAYLLTLTLSVAHKHNQVCVYFFSKLLRISKIVAC